MHKDAADADADDDDVPANEDVNIGGCEVRLIGWLITRGGASTNDGRPPRTLLLVEEVK